MAYRNPYIFFELDHLSGPAAVDAALTRRLRKKVLAEFDLTEAASVDWHGEQVDKATALGIADELEDPHRREMHWKVFRMPGLADFLRHPDPEKLRRLPPRNQIQDTALLHFLQPWLRDALAQLLNEYLRSKMYQSCTLVLHKMELLEPEDLEKALEKFRVWALELERSLDEVVECMEAAKPVLVPYTSYYEPARIALLNAAPDSIASIRAGYAKSLCNLAVAVYNRQREPNQAQEILQAALSLKTDSLTREKVHELALEMKNHQNRRSVFTSGQERARTKNSESAPFRVILVILIVCVKIIIISRTCSRSSGTPDFRIPDFSQHSYTPPHVIPPHPIPLDSLMSLLDAAPEKRPDGFQPDISKASTYHYDEPRHNVYQKVIENRYSDYTHTGELRIHNRTGVDVIVFVYAGMFTPEVFTCYIPAGQQTWMNVHGSIKMDITYHAGKHYMHPLLVLDEGKLDVPGFAEPKTWFYHKSAGRYPAPRGTLHFKGATGDTDSLRITLSRSEITVKDYSP